MYFAVMFPRESQQRPVTACAEVPGFLTLQVPAGVQAQPASNPGTAEHAAPTGAEVVPQLAVPLHALQMEAQYAATFVPEQAPAAVQVSPYVHAFPSSHAEPAAFVPATQMPFTHR